MPSGRGLLLAFEQPGFHAITTRAMSFCLDILWVGADKSVAWWVNEVPQPQFGGFSLTTDRAYQGGGVYTPKVPASYVLELGAGEMQRLGLKLGDVLRF